MGMVAVRGVAARDAVIRGLLPPWYFRQLFDQIIRIGYNSLPVVGLTELLAEHLVEDQKTEG